MCPVNVHVQVESDLLHKKHLVRFTPEEVCMLLEEMGLDRLDLRAIRLHRISGEQGGWRGGQEGGRGEDGQEEGREEGRPDSNVGLAETGRPGRNREAWQKHSHKQKSSRQYMVEGANNSPGKV